METLLLYTLKASALLLTFFAAYHLLLKKETFFSANRGFLLAGLITSALLPLVEYTRVIWVNPKPVQQLSAAQLGYLATALKGQAVQVAQPQPFNWWYVAGAVYILGIAFFMVALFTDIFKIRKMLRSKEVIQQQPYKLVDSPAVASPFSFFNYIVFNSSTLAPQELESIISHEKVHSRQKHTLDMLLSQAYCILFWFNPVAWLYKKAIAQNLEFIADAEALKQVADKTAYQKTMLRLALGTQPISITNHFYQSLIKKRIVMLNKQRSHKYSTWKYALVLPVLALFTMAFQVKTVAREKSAPQTTSSSHSEESVTIQTEINKDSDKNKELDGLKKKFAEIGVDFNVSFIEKNDKGEITAIKVELKGEGQEQVYNVKSSDPIKPFIVTAKQQNGKLVGISIYPGIKKLPKGAVMAVEAADDVMPTEEAEVAADMIPAPPVPGLEPRMAPPVPQRRFGQDPDGTTVAMNITDNTLVLVDGIKQPKGAPVKLPVGREIASVNVLKGKEGKKKYGKEAKDGAIEITTAKKRADKVSVNRINVPGSAAFAFSMPDGDVSGDILEFHGALPEGLEAFADLGQLDFSELEKLGDLKIFSDIESMSNDDINAWAAHASRLAERAGRQAELAARRAEIAGRKAIIIDKRADRENRNADNATLRKQLEEAKKQLEETKKELKKQIAKQKAAAGKKA